MTRLLAIGGSLRSASYNSALLRAAAASCPPGVEFVLWSGLGAIPAYDEDLERVPPPVVLLKEELAAADAVLFATPEYNGSVPGALKNALDWASLPFRSNPLRGKPVAVVGASGGAFGAAWAQAELRKVLRTIGARVEERELVVPRAHHAFDRDGTLLDPEIVAALRTVTLRLLEATREEAA